MKRLIQFILFVLLFRSAIGQPTRYGNEWIDYSKTYCKVYVTTDGMYHIPFSLLNKYIPNFTGINPAKLVMVHNGLPIPMYLATDSGGIIDSISYVEFFGKKNIGDVDSALYMQPGYQPHPYYSLFSDTSVYYLTVSSQTNNPHYQFVNNDTASIPSITPDQYFMYSSHTFYTASGTYNAGRNYVIDNENLYKSIYDREEGWGSGWINFSAPNGLTINLATPSIYAAGPSATVNVNIDIRSWEQHNIVTTLNAAPLATLNFDNSGGGLDRIGRTAALSGSKMQRECRERLQNLARHLQRRLVRL